MIEARGEGVSIQPGAAVERAGRLAAQRDRPAIDTIDQPARPAKGDGRVRSASPDPRARRANPPNSQRDERRMAPRSTGPISDDRRPAGTDAALSSSRSVTPGHAA